MQTITLDAYPPTFHKGQPLPSGPPTTYLKPQRACDICRRRKTKCDGPTRPDHVCSNCLTTRQRCTYLETSKPRGPPKAYVSRLEDKVEATERLIKRLQPQLDLEKLIGPDVPRGSWRSDFPHRPTSDAAQPPGPGSSREADYPKLAIRPKVGDTATTSGQRHTDPNETVTEYEYDSSSEKDDSEGDEGPRLLGQAQIPYRNRYVGKSSGRSLLQATFAMKEEHRGSRSAPTTDIDLPEYERRAHRELQPIVLLTFPPPDLCNSLIDLYFIHVNPHFPLLHRPTFQSQYKSSLHFRDRAFGAALLAVFAVAARWSDDTRVLDSPDQPLTAGWRFLKEQFKYRPAALAPPYLFDLQRISLISSFLRWTSHASVAWSMNALGIRLAQDAGAHRKKSYPSTPNVEGELWKRAFWLLVIYDRISSASLGRPCVIREEDFDIDLPIEIADEYWIHRDPRQAFKQPPGTPCLNTYMICFIKMTQMMAFTLRTVYCIDKTKVLLGLVGPSWREQVVGQLDAAMEEWISSVPAWLKWAPDMPAEWAMQSAALYTSYYLLVLLVYRPFIPPPNVQRINGKPQPPGAYPFPSLSLCVSAAHSAVHIVRTQLDKKEFNIPSFLAVSHLSGAILLMNIWEVKKQDPIANVEKEITDVHTCLRALEIGKERWETASIGFLKAGLPDSEKEKPETPASPPPRPSPPSAQPERAHDRAMQPPRLTDGWHWFSQVDIASQYQSTPPVPSPLQSTVDVQPYTRFSDIPRARAQPSEHADTTNLSQIPPSYRIRAMPPQIQGHRQPTVSEVPVITTVRGQLPWWAEAAVDGRPAYGTVADEVAKIFLTGQTAVYQPPR